MNDSVDVSLAPYKKSTRLFILLSALEAMVGNLISGTYLAKLTTSIGMSDSTTALLSTVGSLAAAIQILSIFLASKVPYKRWVLPLQTFAESAYGVLYIVPIIKLGNRELGIILFSIVLLAGCAKQVYAPLRKSWSMNMVHPAERTAYSTKNSLFTAIVRLFFIYFIGALIDYYDAKSELNTAFIIIAIIIFTFGFLQSLILLFAKERVVEVEKKASPFSEVKTLFKNKNFRNLWFISAAYNVIGSLASPFYNTYQIKELGLSMTFISTMTIIEVLLYILFLSINTRLAKKKNATYFYRFVHASSAVNIGFMIFATPKTAAFIMISRQFIIAFYAASSIAGATVIYDIAKPHQFASADIIISLTNGLLGFFTTLAITPFFDYLSRSHPSLFGIDMYPQQFLSVIASVLAIFLALFVNLVFIPGIKRTNSEKEEFVNPKP